MIDFQVYTALCPVADGHHDNIEARPNAKREAIYVPFGENSSSLGAA